MPGAEPDSNQKTLPTETAVAATSEGTTTHHHTAMAAAATAGASRETISPTSLRVIQFNARRGHNNLRSILAILDHWGQPSTRFALEHCLLDSSTLESLPINDQQFCKSIFDRQERSARLHISHLENDPDTANGSVFQQSIETLHRLIALNQVVKCSTIPGNENKTKEFFKQLGMSEQPNKEEIEEEARRLADRLQELSEIADTLPAVVESTPLHSPDYLVDLEIKEALDDIQNNAPKNKEEYINMAKKAAQDFHRAQQEQENQATNSTPQYLSRLTAQKRRVLDQIIKLFNLPDKEAQNVARNLFNEELGPNVIEEINQECEGKIQEHEKLSNRLRIISESVNENSPIEILENAEKRYDEIENSLNAHRRAIAELQRDSTTLRVLTMADSLTPLHPETVLDLQRYYLYNYLTTLSNAAVVVRIPIEPSFQLPSNALGALLQLHTFAPNLVLRIPNSAADAVTRLPSNHSTDAQSFLTLEALELPETSTATAAASEETGVYHPAAMAAAASEETGVYHPAATAAAASEETDGYSSDSDLEEPAPDTAAGEGATAAESATPASTDMAAAATSSVRVTHDNPLSKSA